MEISNKIRKFLNSKQAKANYLYILGIIVIVVIAGGFLSNGGDFKIDLSQFGLGGGGSGEVVNRQVQFTVTDKYSGTAAGSKTLYVYSQGGALLETLTTAASGIIQTAKSYESGTVLNVKYVDSNSKKWYSVTVPTMPASEVESQTYNNIDLESFTIGTYTTDTLKAAGSTIADAGEYNQTTSGATPVFTYSLDNTGNDNTGLMNSYDPVYAQNWQVWVVVSFSGTGYENIVLSGFGTYYTLGTTNYGASQLSPDSLTKWKVGSNYLAGYSGGDSMQFSLDMSGYSGTAVTMQITAYAYADPVFAASHGGSLGQNALTIAEQTVTLST